MNEHSEPQATNRLAQETSPYLLQHAHNPVDWYSWGPEALARARAEDRPVLLSIGYSACHWCHVMAHESFEDPETARLMNEHFVNIKVDREERPDLDALYMEAVQAMTGHGGWPMTVFLTPDGEPFYGGTYYPPEPRHGMPAFRQVLTAVADAWRNRRGELEANGTRVVEALRHGAELQPGATALSNELLDQAAKALLGAFDKMEGGFGGAPKFPQPMVLDFLLAYQSRNGSDGILRSVIHTLRKMARGGMYDQVGGGFHRYSTDALWLVPHFEKMLYDNAQLARSYLHAFQVTGDSEFERIVEETLEYVLREMTSPDGAFHSSQDADSEGKEGEFFLWTPREVVDILGHEEARIFGVYYGMSDVGNFREGGPGKNILHVAEDAEAVARSFNIRPERVREIAARGRRELFARRRGRVAPGRDDKILVEWNALMIHAFAEAGAALGRPEWVGAARRAADFILTRMTFTANDGSLRLYRSFNQGRAALNAYLEDYASLGLALLALYEATFENRWLQAAAALPPVILHLFFDSGNGGFFQTSPEHEQLVVRRKEFVDNAVPSGNSLAAELFLRLGRFLGREDYAGYAAAIARMMVDAMPRQPLAFGRLLSALDLHLNPGFEIAIVGRRDADDTRALLAEIHRRFLPTSIVALREPGDGVLDEMAPLFEGREQRNDRATAYVCRNYVCGMPVTDAEGLKKQLR